ncbi:MAG: lactonase family protein [Clostridiales bacterium]|jgi:6-phosphogluconolactonase|nr:lactonase family protein [Clostridiales bacterium]
MTERTIVFIGTYTSAKNSKSQGIYIHELDASTGSLSLKGACDAQEPSYLALNKAQTHLYAVNEFASYEGASSGAVSAFEFNGKSLELKFLNSKPSGGSYPCHILLDADGKYAFVSNYGGGSLSVFPVNSDGSLADCCHFIQHEGKGSDPKRQEGPHTHSTCFDTSNQRLFALDLGLDSLIAYTFDSNGNRLSLDPKALYDAAPGSGPRHCEFSANGKFCYCANELNSTISAFSYDSDSGRLSLIGTYPSPSSSFGAGYADIHTFPSGNFLYVSDRKSNSIICYHIEENTGMLAFSCAFPSGGKTPRSFAIDPSGNFLVVANQDSDCLASFNIDKESGSLAKLGEYYSPAPACVKICLLSV